jgi:YVTN family beta-propeller protein
LAGALVGVAPDGVSAVAARSRCRATAFVTNSNSDSVSTIDVETRGKHPDDIPVGATPNDVAVHAGRQDRLHHQLRQRHGVDD